MTGWKGRPSAGRSGLPAAVACVFVVLLSLLIQTVRADTTVSGHVLVRLQTGADIHAVSASYGISVQDRIDGWRLYSLQVPAGSESAYAQQLQADPRVLYAEPDAAVGMPEVTGTQFHFAFDAGPDPGKYVNQYAYAQVNLDESLSTADGMGISVAILDTGATFEHPALRKHYRHGYNTLQPGTSPLDLPDGVVNGAVGHGTMLAGIVAHIAPHAKILPIRVLNGDGYGTMMHVLIGLHYAVTHRARVINMSFGTSQPSSALNDAISEAQNAGVVLVAAAGNDGRDIAQYPAACAGVLAIASVESNDRKSSYSNYGTYIAAVAPGSGIRSTYWTGGYADWSGTSFAAPFIAAEAALFLSENSTLTANDFVNTLFQSTRSIDELNPGYEGLLGAGIIDIEEAVLSQANQ